VPVLVGSVEFRWELPQPWQRRIFFPRRKTATQGHRWLLVCGAAEAGIAVAIAAPAAATKRAREENAHFFSMAQAAIYCCFPRRL